MIGLIQILVFLVAIYLIYLIYKGVEIFQIAFVASDTIETRTKGLAIGVFATIVAVILASFAVYLMVDVASQMSTDMPRFPR